jgi:hypothetical protein
VKRVDDELLLAEDRQRTQGDLERDKHQQQDRGPNKLAAPAMVGQHVTARRRDEQRDRCRTDAMNEMDGDFRIPMRWNDVPERKREIRNRQPCPRVPHRRADDDLYVDGRSRNDGDTSQSVIVLSCRAARTL